MYSAVLACGRVHAIASVNVVVLSILQVEGPMPQTQSLRYKLPLLNTAIVCVVICAVSFLGYRQIRRVLEENASTRLHGVASQLSGMLDDATRRSAREATTFAGNAALNAFFVSPDSTTRDAALRAMQARIDTGPSIVSI